MTEFFVFAVLAFPLLVTLAWVVALRRVARADDDFDGGFRVENEVRVTRIRSPHVRSDQ